MNKLYKILFITIIGLFVAGITSASIPQYWSTVDSLIPRTTNTVDIGSTSKRVKKIWTTDMDISGAFTLGGTVATGGIDMASSTITNIGDAGTDFTSSGGLTLAENANLYLSSTGEDDDGELMFLQSMSTTSKATISWRDYLGNDIAWATAHLYSSGGSLHKHWSLETSDTTGALQTRLGIPYDCDYDCQVQINQSNLKITRNAEQTNGNLYMGGNQGHENYFRFYPNYADNATVVFKVATSTDNMIELSAMGATTISVPEILRLENTDLSLNGSSADIVGSTDIDIYPDGQTTRGFRIGQDGSSINLSALGTSQITVGDHLNVSGGAIKAGNYTSDPCGSLIEGMMFYNNTSDYYCFCDGSGVDKKVSDNGACF